jgi:hypothetical protein
MTRYGPLEKPGEAKAAAIGNQLRIPTRPNQRVRY